MDSTLVAIQSDEIEQYWSLVEDLIGQACTRTDKYNKEDIKSNLKEAKQQLWLSVKETVEAVCITEIIQYQRAKYLNILITVGTNKEGWEDYISEIEKWAKEIGCTGVEILCRKGWARVHEKRGYKMSHVYIEKGI